MISEVEAMATEQNRVAVVHGDVFWLPEAGEYLSGLSVPAIERIVGPMTVRAQNTLTRMTAKFL